MSRKDSERKVVGQMMRIYCRHHHRTADSLCAECEALLSYAHRRIEHCPHGEQKSTCRRCPTHCYAPERREQIRAVMRYAGPRMMRYHPIAAIRHLLRELK